MKSFGAIKAFVTCFLFPTKNRPPSLPLHNTLHYLSVSVSVSEPQTKTLSLSLSLRASKNVIVAVNGVADPPTPRDLRREVRQLQAQIRNHLPNLHRPPPHRLLPFSPLPNLPNPNLLPPSDHRLRRRLRRPLHGPPDRHLRLRLPPGPNAHAPQGNQGLRHLQVHRGRFRQGPDLPHHRGSRYQRHVGVGNGGAVARRRAGGPRRGGVDRSGARREGEFGGEWD